jgi:hypothetical protein
VPAAKTAVEFGVHAAVETVPAELLLQLGFTPHVPEGAFPPPAPPVAPSMSQ